MCLRSKDQSRIGGRTEAMSYELRVVSIEFEYQDLSIEYQDLRSKEEERLNTKAPIPSLRGTKQTLKQIEQILKINPSFP